jgi:ABC-type transporter Mla subunit MlaD
MTFIRNLKKRALTVDRAIISDILLWLLVALLLAYFIKLFAIDIPEQHGQRITLPFHDASAIIVGSPVRMMGLEIGYVSNIQVRNDHIDVTIQTNPDSVPLPSGTTFTILFTGLGGSESIEAALPEDVKPKDLKSDKPVYLVNEPIRLNKVLKTSTDVTQALQQGAENIADFFGKKKPISILQLNIRQVNDWSNSAMSVAGKVESGLSKAQNVVGKSAKTQLATLDIINHQLQQATQITSKGSGKVAKLFDQLGASHQATASFSHKSDNKQDNLQDGLAQINDLFTAPESPFYGALQWGQWGSDAAGRLVGQPAQTRSVVMTLPKTAKPQSDPTAVPTDSSPQQGIPGYIASASQWLSTHPLPPMLDNARKSIQGFNEQVVIWQQQLEVKMAKKAGSKVP